MIELRKGSTVFKVFEAETEEVGMAGIIMKTDIFMAGMRVPITALREFAQRILDEVTHHVRPTQP